jgi:hypothetical protein
LLEKCLIFEISLLLLSGSNYERDKIIDIRIQRKAAQKLEI